MKKIAVFFSTGFGSGYFPIIPGTAGTVVGVVIFYLIKSFNIYLYSIITILTLIIGLISVYFSEDFFLAKDPSEIVIDEITGFFITMFFIPATLKNILFGFIIFRIMDIIKPFPIRKIETLKEPFGIMFDDVLAGIYANLMMQCYIRVSS